MRLNNRPQKDGLEAIYSCGLTVIGTWNSRRMQHDDFCNSPTGKYILRLEAHFYDPPKYLITGVYRQVLIVIAYILLIFGIVIALSLIHI